MNSDRIKGTIDNVGGRVQAAVGDVTGDRSQQAEGVVRQAAGQAQNAYGQAKDAVSDYVDAAQDRAQGAAQRVTEKAQDLYGQAQERWAGATDAAGDYAAEAYNNGGHYARRSVGFARKEIEEYPLAAVLLAGAVGYLMALVFHKR